MANEITVLAGLTVSKSDLKVSIPTLSKQFTMTGTYYSAGVQLIGTTHEILSISADLVTAGWAWFKNVDPTNFIEVGIDAAGTFHPLLKLLASEFALCPLTTKAIYARANTAAAKLEYNVVER